MKLHFVIPGDREAGIPDTSGTIEDSFGDVEGDRETVRADWEQTIKCHYGEGKVKVWFDDECGSCESILIEGLCHRCHKNALFAKRYGNNSPNIRCLNCSNMHSAQKLLELASEFWQLFTEAKFGAVCELQPQGFKFKKITEVHDSIDVELVECPKCLKNQGEGQNETSRVSGEHSKD